MSVSSIAHSLLRVALLGCCFALESCSESQIEFSKVSTVGTPDLPLEFRAAFQTFIKGNHQWRYQTKTIRRENKWQAALVGSLSNVEAASFAKFANVELFEIGEQTDMMKDWEMSFPDMQLGKHRTSAQQGSGYMQLSEESVFVVIVYDPKSLAIDIAMEGVHGKREKSRKGSVDDS